MRGRRSGLQGIFLGLVGVLVGAQLSFGAGFGLYEGSARGNALGGAMVGRADDPSALFYNPAGITQLEGIQVEAGVTAIAPSTDVRTKDNIYHTPTITTSTEDNVWVPPHFYTSYQFNKSVWFGLGVFSPFGLGTEFDENWPGRYNSYEAVIQSLNVNPNIALKLTDNFSVAAGLDIVWFDLKLKQKIDASGQNNPSVYTFDVDQSLKGDSVGYGMNVALHYKPFEWLAMGASYRSQVKENVEGDVDFEKPAVLANRPELFPDTGASGAITLPDEVFLGVVVKPIDRLSLEVGGVWTNWSTYHDLTIKYDKPIAINPRTGQPIQSVQRMKDWEDVWRFQFGAEYKTTDWLDLRAGYTYDTEPSPDEYVDYLIPANDRHMFSVGPGFHWKGWTLDLSYTYLMIEERHVEQRIQEGVLESDFEDGQAHLFGASLSYKF